MRSDLRLRLREITKSLSTRKTGVTGVPGVPDRPLHLLVHPGATPEASEKPQQNQRVTPVTPCYTLEKEGGEIRYTSTGVAAGVAEGVASSADWLAHFDERAGIMEFDGSLTRDEAERRALAETVAALGPKPSVH